MATKLRVGVIGVGTIGTVHSEAYQNTGEAELAAICDIDKAKLAAKGDRFGVKGRFEDYRELLKSDLDAVSICVPNALHCESAIAALRAGKKVLVEKPMAMNARQAQEMAEVARKTKGLLQVGMCRRQMPECQVLKEYIDAGLLGEIYHMRTVLMRHRGVPGLGGWFTTKDQSGGGPLIDVGVHWFDLALWLSGLWEPTRVSARTYAKFGPRMRDYRYVSMWAGPPKFEGTFDVEDYATGMVRFGNKATLTLEISWAANSSGDNNFVELLGDKGGARVMDGKPLKIVTEHQGRPTDILPQFDTRANAFELQARRFLAACRGEQPPAATAEQGVAVMKLIDAIYASSEKGEEVAV